MAEVGCCVRVVATMMVDGVDASSFRRARGERGGKCEILLHEKAARGVTSKKIREDS